MKNTCPYCGYDFDTTHEFCNSSCPLSKHCGMIMCPNCRYEYVPAESRTINFFKKLFSSKKSSQEIEETNEHPDIPH
ncbi:MAG: hypothetical protein MAGBODY4_01245 [Candidatus Marinimicrobia bacterium]|nr:hypothetical protein [Candidatus Neomarinimicrobiota bacterium]